ncbi:MAG: hypothetical protein U9O53_00740 [archaeon]|nr:hypothetical protein [archaeon]
MKMEKIHFTKRLFNKRNKYLLGIAFMNIIIAGLLLMDKKYASGFAIIKKTVS